MGFPSLHMSRTNSQDKHDLDIQVVFGSAAIASYKSNGVTIARTAVGKFDVTLPAKYLRIQSCAATWLRATAAAPLQVHITDTSSLASDGVISIETVVAAGTVTEPAADSELYLTIGVTQDPINERVGG